MTINQLFNIDTFTKFEKWMLVNYIFNLPMDMKLWTIQNFSKLMDDVYKYDRLITYSSLCEEGIKKLKNKIPKYIHIESSEFLCELNFQKEYAMILDGLQDAVRNPSTLFDFSNIVFDNNIVCKSGICDKPENIIDLLGKISEKMDIRKEKLHGIKDYTKLSELLSTILFLLIPHKIKIAFEVNLLADKRFELFNMADITKELYRTTINSYEKMFLNDTFGDMVCSVKQFVQLCLSIKQNLGDSNFKYDDQSVLMIESFLINAIQILRENSEITINNSGFKEIMRRSSLDKPEVIVVKPDILPQSDNITYNIPEKIKCAIMTSFPNAKLENVMDGELNEYLYLNILHETEDCEVENGKYLLYMKSDDIIIGNSINEDGSFGDNEINLLYMDTWSEYEFKEEF